VNYVTVNYVTKDFIKRLLAITRACKSCIFKQFLVEVMVTY